MSLGHSVVNSDHSAQAGQWPPGPVRLETVPNPNLSSNLSPNLNLNLTQYKMNSPDAAM